jgi:hypothetical protein
MCKYIDSCDFVCMKTYHEISDLSSVNHPNCTVGTKPEVLVSYILVFVSWEWNAFLPF